MSDTNFYKWLYTIDGTGNPSCPVVVGRNLPFLKPSDAVNYYMERFPEEEPAKGIIEHDTRRARELAIVSQYELTYLIHVIDGMVKDYREKANAKWDEVEAKPDGLIGRIEKEVLKEQAIRLGSTASGLSEAWSVLHSRAYELNRIATMKG